MVIITRALEESEGVQKVTFELETETFLLEVSDKFRLAQVSEKVRLAGEEHDQRKGLKARPPWIVKTVT